MQKSALGFVVATIVAVILVYPAPSSAQVTRAFVSGNGDDNNPCSVTLPCRTFAVAITKTTAGGDIVALTPAGYGPVTITKSISITNDGAGEVAVTAPAGGNGITINAGSSDVINLRGLTIDGLGVAFAGINVSSAGLVQVQNSVIRNFQNGSAGYGINFTAPAGSNLMVSDTILSNNGTSSTGAGIRVDPQESTGYVQIILNRIQSIGNVTGLRIEYLSVNGIAVINAIARDSVFAANRGSGIAVIGPSSINATLVVTAERSALFGNALNGFRTDGSSVTGVLIGSTLSANSNALAEQNNSHICTFGDNNIFLNVPPDNSAPNCTLPQK